MRVRLIVLGVALVASVALAGCAGEMNDAVDGGASAGGETSSSRGTSYNYNSGGSSNAESDSGTFQAPDGQADVSASAGGTGRLTVTIEDASGATVFEETYTGSGGENTNRELSGAPGEWTVRIDVLTWQGGFTLTANGR